MLIQSEILGIPSRRGLLVISQFPRIPIPPSPGMGCWPHPSSQGFPTEIGALYPEQIRGPLHNGVLSLPLCEWDASPRHCSRLWGSPWQWNAGPTVSLGCPSERLPPHPGLWGSPQN